MKESIITIDWELLDNISYQSNLGKSLKNTLRKFDKEELFDEIDDMIINFHTSISDDIFPYENRIKSLQSCVLKYKKYYPSTPVEKAFNDILGIRIIVDNYDVVDAINLPDNVRVADMRLGKANDDGYRGIHIYFQKDHYHYPIEFQFVTVRDRQFNEWLHIYLYKYVADNSIGTKLRSMYDADEIKSEDDFVKEMRKCVM